VLGDADIVLAPAVIAEQLVPLTEWLLARVVGVAAGTVELFELEILASGAPALFLVVFVLVDRHAAYIIAAWHGLGRDIPLRVIALR